MNPDLDKLHAYPFTRLDELKAGLTAPSKLSPVSLAIGEPRHATPQFILEALAVAGRNLGQYPQAAGLPALRESCAQWLARRYQVSADAGTMILPLTGTREGLFAIAQCIIDRDRDAAVLMPNPFYQIYEGAALMAGAEPVYLNTIAENDYLPELDAVPESVWKRCQLLYTCSPGNPTGAVMNLAYLSRLLELAHRYDFVIAADECYAEIYADEQNPPPGLLQACLDFGDPRFRHCLIFHSLSKRSNVPGLRSGFVAGDPELIKNFRLYRSYHGCAMPVHHQLASIAAWNDDDHVVGNRQLYREKFATAGRRIATVLNCQIPPAAFYLWAETPIDDESFTARLYKEHNVTVLPGSYLARDTVGGNPGRNHVRLSLVAEPDQCIEAAERIEQFVNSL